MEIKSAKYLAEHSDELLDILAKNGGSVLITKNDEARAVILSYSLYQEMKKTFNLLKFLEKSEVDLRTGKIIAHDELKKQMGTRINELKEVDTSEL